MRIPERAKPPEGGAGRGRGRATATGIGRLIPQRFSTGFVPAGAGAAVMRKAPAPGAEVAEVDGEGRKARAGAPNYRPGPGPRALPKGCS